MTEQRQCAGAIVGKTQGELDPVDIAAPLNDPRFIDAALDKCAVSSGQRFDFGARDLVHVALGICRAESKRDGEDTTWFQQCHQLAKRARPITRRHMLPDPGQQDQVESETRAMGDFERRQSIVKPADPRVRMPHRCFAQHR